MKTEGRDSLYWSAWDGSRNGSVTLLKPGKKIKLFLKKIVYETYLVNQLKTYPIAIYVPKHNLSVPSKIDTFIM